MISTAPTHAHSANHEQERAAREDRRRGGIGGLGGARLGGDHQPVDLSDQVDREVAVAGEQLGLAALDPKLPGEDAEHALFAQPEREQSVEDRRRFVVEGRPRERPQVSLDAVDRSFEAFPQRLNQ